MKRHNLISLVLFAILITLPASAQYAQNRYRFPGDSIGAMVHQGEHAEFTPWNDQTRVVAGTDNDWYYIYTADKFGGECGVYASRLDSNGNLLWTRCVNNAPKEQIDPTLCTVPGGIVVTWLDGRERAYGSIYAQRLDANGNRLWNVTSQSDTVNALQIAYAPRTRFSKKIASDGNSVFIVWEDSRAGGGAALYAVKLNLDGSVATGYTANGVPLATTQGAYPSEENYQLVVDSIRNSVWVTYAENRGMNNYSVRGQFLGTNGVRWDSAGVVIANRQSQVFSLRACTDGRGGCFVSWIESDSANRYQQRLARFDSTGTLIWSNVIARAQALSRYANWLFPSGTDTCLLGRVIFSQNSFLELRIHRITGANSSQLIWGDNGSAMNTPSNFESGDFIVVSCGKGALASWHTSDMGSVYHTQQLLATGQLAWGTQSNPRTIQIESQTHYTDWLQAATADRMLWLWINRSVDHQDLMRVCGGGDPVGSTPNPGTAIQRFNNEEVLYNPAVSVSPNGTVYHSYYTSTRKMLRIHNLDAPPSTHAESTMIFPDTTFRVSDRYDWNVNIEQAPVITPNNEAIIFAVREDSSRRIYAQKFNSTGTPLWNSTGIDISGFVENPNKIRAVSDGSGGAYVTYNISGGPPNYVSETHFQHLQSNGSVTCNPPGSLLTSTTVETYDQRIALHASGIYLLTLELVDFTMEHPYSVRLRKVNTSGSIVWTRTVADSIQMENTFKNIGLAVDSTGDIVVCWTYWLSISSSLPPSNCRLQKYSPDGARFWGPTGVSVCDSVSIIHNIDLIADQSGYWVGWYNNNNPRRSCQRISLNGVRQFEPQGRVVALSSNPDNQDQLVLIPGRNSSCYFFWRQYTTYDSINFTCDFKVAGRHLNPDGSDADPITWQGNHIGIAALANGSQLYGATTPDGGAILDYTIESGGHGPFFDIYTQRISDNTCVSVSEIPSTKLPDEFALLPNYPNPFNGATLLRFHVPRDAKISLVLYDVMGREVIRLVDGEYKTGSYQVSWNGKSRGGVQTASGVYFCRMIAGSFDKTEKLVKLQ